MKICTFTVMPSFLYPLCRFFECLATHALGNGMPILLDNQLIYYNHFKNARKSHAHTAWQVAHFVLAKDMVEIVSDACSFWPQHDDKPQVNVRPIYTCSWKLKGSNFPQVCYPKATLQVWLTSTVGRALGVRLYIHADVLVLALSPPS